VGKGCWNAEKMPKFGSKCKGLKFDSISLTDRSPVDKENLI
jgi:hypothetical protein